MNHVVNKISRQFYCAAGVATSALLIGCLACIYFSRYWQYYEISINLLINFICMIVTIQFVQRLFTIEDDKKKKQLERDQILRSAKVLSLLMQDYVIAGYCISVPVEKRITGIPNQNEIKIPDEFSLQDMSSMFLRSISLTKNMHDSTVVLFYKAEKRIRNYMIEMLGSIDFFYYPEFSEIITEFIDVSISFDGSDAIVQAPFVPMGHTGQSQAEFIIKNMIEPGTTDYVTGVLDGTIKSNVIAPYVMLYVALVKENRILKKYNLKIEQLKAEV